MRGGGGGDSKRDERCGGGETPSGMRVGGGGYSKRDESGGGETPSGMRGGFVSKSITLNGIDNQFCSLLAPATAFDNLYCILLSMQTVSLLIMVLHTTHHPTHWRHSPAGFAASVAVRIQYAASCASLLPDHVTLA